MRRWVGVGMVLVGATLVCGADVQSLEIALDEAVRAYDLTAATVALSEARDAVAETPSDRLTILHVRASLAVAELIRIEFENLPATQAEKRRGLGQRIDATALEGLGLVKSMPVTSETERMKADLLATMIRSDFRAKKYESEFKNAVARAMDLDRENPKAWVSSAKPFLFAPVGRGRDLDQAIRVLDKALSLDPTLESALLLRALAREEAGETAAAQADRQAALDLNPRCRPAEEALANTP